MKSLLITIFALGLMGLMIQPALYSQEDEWDEVLDIASGKVAAIDLTANKLSITDVEGVSQEFVLDPDLTVVWDDTADEEKELSDLIVGKDVVVEFRTDDGGKKMATWVDLVAVEEDLPVPSDEEISPQDDTVIE